MPRLDAKDIETALVGFLLNDTDGQFAMALEEATENEDPPAIESAVSFAEAELLTRDNGLVLKMSDGTEFQLTIVQSR